MPLINTPVPNLIQGVSQQPDATRFAGQCEEQENALSSVADGLKKRPNTRHIARLLTWAINSNSFVHFIDRNDAEKYVIIHNGTTLKAWNVITGNPATINGASSYAYTPDAGSYLDTSTPRTTLKALTVSDNTFLVNNTVKVEQSATLAPSLAHEAVVYVAQGDYQKEYEVSFSDSRPFQISFTPNRTAFWNVNFMSWYSSNLTITTGTDLSYDNWYAFDIHSERTATVTESGAGYEPSKTFDDNYIVTVNQTLTPSGNSWQAKHQSFNVKLETNASGEVTAAKVQPLSSGYPFYASWLDNAYGNSSPYTSRYFFQTPQSTSAAFGSLGKVVFKSGSASESLGGANADSKQIAKGLGYDSTESSNGERTSGTNLIIDDDETTTGLKQPTVRGSVIKYQRTDGQDFKIATTDGLSDTGLIASYKQTTSIDRLPEQNFNGFQIKITGDSDLNEDDYYVKFETNDGGEFGAGAYNEVTAFGAAYKINPDTLPMRLINTDVDTFTISTVPFEDREAGDDNSNPFPSFVGKKISGLFFFKNRLGILANENVSMSESGHFFNFFRKTTTTLLDSACIDVAVNSKQVTNLRSAVGFQENLVLFSDNGQFVLKGGDLLTPKTVSINPITNFNFEGQVEPLPLGSYIYFPFTRGTFTGMREFTVNSTTDTYDSVEVTEHVPSYIPSNIIDMAGTTSEDMIALVSFNEKSSVYIYNYFWNNNQKVLSAWSKFTFTGDIRGIEFIGSTLYAVITNGTETNLVEMPLEAGLTDSAGFVTHLDMRVANTVTHGDNQITLPYTPADNSVEVYTKDGLKLNATNSGDTVTLSQAVNDVDADGNDIDTNVFVGIPYTMKYTFSEQLFKAKAGNSTSPSNAAKLMIRNGSLYFDKTAFFKVKVTPKQRETYENVFTPDVIGATSIGTLYLDSGFYRFPVLTKAQDTKISIENDSALPSNFQSAEFESFMHSRSSRYA